MKREAAEITPMSEGENNAVIKSNRTVARQSWFRKKKPKGNVTLVRSRFSRGKCGHRHLGLE